MNVLVVGGTRNVGYSLTWRLLAAGHRVTLFNRGTIPDPFGDRVARLRGDRTRDPLPEARFDGVVDFAAYDARAARQALGLNAGHTVFISSGAVYLVREGCPSPARENDYDGPLLARPDAPEDVEEWEYGMGKRACEDVLAGSAATRIRIPMVNSERDPYRRIEGYLWRILDAGPVLLPNAGGHVARHVYGPTVAEAIAGMLGDRRTFGQAYNLAQDETPTLFELVRMLCEILGAPARIVPAPAALLDQEGIRPDAISPFSTGWMSNIDPARAKSELGFRHPPLREYLSRIVASFLAHPPAGPPKDYAMRTRERELARRLS
ncbi:MAG: epimerase [Planctomycetes bacterium]|nr:epimerase [Planctomycetota bacterium]